MLVGEQPGDHEDREGAPFVGPAGRLLREAMHDAGIAAEDAYLTNAVKHFKFERRGSVRIHKKPSIAEVRACSPWLSAELRLIALALVVAMGATAGSGRPGDARPWHAATERRRAHRGPDGSPFVLLRAPDAAARADQRARFVDDLRRANDLTRW